MTPAWTGNAQARMANGGGVAPNRGVWQASQVPGAGGNPPYPFAGPPAGGQGAFPGAWVSQSWNRHWEAGAGAYGWKFDVEKEIPYFPLQYSGARQLMQIGAAPLRCDKRLANTLLWDMFAANQSATGWVLSHAIGKGWKKERNKREAETLARALDLAIIEMGTDYVEKSAAWEVLIRRLRAVVLADKMGKWDLPMLLEELPSEKSPDFHQVVVRDLVKTNQLSESAMGKSPLPAQDD